MSTTAAAATARSTTATTAWSCVRDGSTGRCGLRLARSIIPCHSASRWDAIRLNRETEALPRAWPPLERYDATRSAAIAPSAFAHKAMAAPAVAVAPSSPWAHPQEDAVVE